MSVVGRIVRNDHEIEQGELVAIGFTHVAQVVVLLPTGVLRSWDLSECKVLPHEPPSKPLPTGYTDDRGVYHPGARHRGGEE